MGLHPAGLFRQLTAASRWCCTTASTSDDRRARRPARRRGATSSTLRCGASSRATTATSPRSSWPTANASTPTRSSSAPGSGCAPSRSRRSASRPVPHPSGLGDFVETDADGETSVPGLYAAGNVTDPSQQVLQAAADGSRVGGDDQLQPGRRRHRSGGAARRPTRPTGIIATAASRSGVATPTAPSSTRSTASTPGRALDVGAGEGGDAVWLAEQGWTVTASDISATRPGPHRCRGRATRPDVECHHADANTLDAFRARRVRSRLCALRIDPSHARRPRRRATCSPPSPPAARCSSSATTSNRCARRSTRRTAQPSVRSRRLRPGRRHRRRARGLAGLGRSRSTRSGPARRSRLARTTSTTSCCAARRRCRLAPGISRTRRQAVGAIPAPAPRRRPWCCRCWLSRAAWRVWWSRSARLGALRAASA